jgi:hypothetical protein
MPGSMPRRRVRGLATLVQHLDDVRPDYRYRRGKLGRLFLGNTIDRLTCHDRHDRWRWFGERDGTAVDMGLV